jgi:hypothetical protein
MDEFLASGESHIRNLEMGLARARDLGRALEIGYMPDQFGHIGQMPQILRLCGLERAMVWRGVPEEIASTAFVWRGPDGSEVLTQYMVFGYFNGEHFERALEPDDLAAALRRSVERLRPFAVGDRMVIMVGYDHAGPDATLPARLERAAPVMPGIEARVGSIAEHLELEDLPAELPVWTGELRSSARAHLLPNVYSARVHQKRERGRVEALVERYAEPLAALTPSFGWPEDEFRRIWTLLCWNGAHDSACGCSHDRVAADVDGRFAEIRTIGEDIVERALTSLGARVAGGSGVIRFNPSLIEREGVPPVGYAVVPVGHDPAMVEVSLERTPEGAGVLADGIPLRFFDEPDVGDLYTFCPEDPAQVPGAPGSIAIHGHEVIAAWDRLLVMARVTRRADEPFLRLEGVIRNERDDHRLRLHVGLPATADGSLAGSPFELVRRPLLGEGSHHEAASPTWPARHLVVAAGTAVFHEGVVEYEVTGDDLAVTLLRAVGSISRERLATRPYAAGPQTPTPVAQMHGETVFTLAVWPDAPEDPAVLLEGWERFGLPIVEAPAAGGGVLPRERSLLAVRSAGAQLSGARRNGDAVEVRLWNPYPDRTVDAVVGSRPCRMSPSRIGSVVLGTGPAVA